MLQNPSGNTSRKESALTIFIVSDGTGQTAERMVQSVLVQFDEPNVRLVKRPRVRTPKRVTTVVQEAAERKALILHTLVSNELRRSIMVQAHNQSVDALDLMGPLLERITLRLHLTPKEKPGLFKQLAEVRQREIEAVDFAFHHDDGQRLDSLKKAEIVLVGVSRTMKTPTMLYLAYRGWFVANVPLILEIPPPPELMAFPAHRVFWLDISALRLLEWRRSRVQSLNMPVHDYISLPYIQKELTHVARICTTKKWSRIDVTGKSVEEVAREILVLYAEKHTARGRKGTMDFQD